jgi:hypothetical protein
MRVVTLNRTGPGRDELAVSLVEAGDVGRAVRHGGTEKEAEAPAVALTAECGDWRVHLRSSHAPYGVSVCVKLVHHRRDMGRRQERGPRRRRAVDYPPVEPEHGGVECPVRSTGVDGNGAGNPPAGVRVGFCIAARFSTAP